MDATAVLVTGLLVLVALAAGAAVGYLLARAHAAPPQLTALLGPAAEALTRVEEQLHAVERDRIDAYAGLREQVAALHRSSNELGAQAGVLSGALRAPQVRGRWGEVQLQRIVELAGMVEHCDFDTQVFVSGNDGGARPDMVIRLAGNRSIPVDAKTPMAAWLQACDLDAPRRDPARYPGAGVDQQRRALLGQHARAVRAHVDALAGKAYWRMFDPAPEFVVMFVPGDAFWDAAQSVDPGLADYAFERRVVVATPSTLIALLRTVAFTWRQERLSTSAQEVHALGRELYHRLSTFGEHLARVGGGLERAVSSYNAAVRSLDSRVLVSARRLADLGVTADELASPMPVDTAVTSTPVTPTSVTSTPVTSTTAAPLHLETVRRR